MASSSTSLISAVVGTMVKPGIIRLASAAGDAGRCRDRARTIACASIRVLALTAERAVAAAMESIIAGRSPSRASVVAAGHVVYVICMRSDSRRYRPGGKEKIGTHRTACLCNAGRVTDQGRPPIPDGTKREVRQRCGFGCVICGRPIYQYDHMIDYSICREHKAANLTLLCPNHHDEKTHGLLSLEVVQAANENPFNRQSGHSAPFHLHYEGQNPVMVLGDVSIEVERVERGVDAIMIDGVPLVGFRFDEDQCFLQMKLFDKDDREVLTVVDNELTYLVDTLDTWDFEFVSRKLTVRSAPREILVRVEFKPPNAVVISRGILQLSRLSRSRFGPMESR